MHKLTKFLAVPALALGLLAPTAALACEQHTSSCGSTCAQGGTVKAALASGGAAVTPVKGTRAQKVEMAVTEQGFVPATVAVKKGQTVQLVITRKTDSTCAKDILVEGTDIHQQLPLNKPVTVSFTPEKSGELRYGCGMNKMVGGVLRVE
jgi:plastocyanin domain-containing protein